MKGQFIFEPGFEEDKKSGILRLIRKLPVRALPNLTLEGENNFEGIPENQQGDSMIYRVEFPGLPGQDLCEVYPLKNRNFLGVHGYIPFSRHKQNFRIVGAWFDQLCVQIEGEVINLHYKPLRNNQ